MPQFTHSAFLRYGIALLTSLLALVLTLILWPQLKAVPFLLFLAAVMVSSWIGRLGPGLLATFFGALAAGYLVVSPVHLSGSDRQIIAMQLGAFALIGGFISISSSALHNAKRDIETRVAERAAEFAKAVDTLRVEIAERDRLAEERAVLLAQERAARTAAELARRRVETLYAVTKETSKSLDLDQVLTTIIRTARDLFAADQAAIYLQDDAGRFVCPVLFGRLATDISRICDTCAVSPICNRAGAAWPPIPTADLTGVPQPIWTSEAMTEAMATEGHLRTLALPLYQFDEIPGFLGIYHNQPRWYTADDIQAARALASQAATAIANTRLYEAERRAHARAEDARRETEALLEATKQITSSLDLTTTLNSILDNIVRLCEADLAGVALVDADGQALQYATARGVHEQLVERLRALRLPLGVGLVGSVASTGQAINSDDVKQDARWIHQPLFEAAGIRSSLVVPLRSREGVIGVLCALSQQPAHFTPVRERLLTALAEQAALAIEHAREIASRARVQDWLSGQKRVLEMIATDFPLPDVLDTLARLIEAQSAACFKFGRKSVDTLEGRPDCWQGGEITRRCKVSSGF